jgi:hypothetical protein
MCLFHLGMEVNRRRQMLVQQLDGLNPDFLWEGVVGMLHGALRFEPSPTLEVQPVRWLDSETTQFVDGSIHLVD